MSEETVPKKKFFGTPEFRAAIDEMKARRDAVPDENGRSFYDLTIRMINAYVPWEDELPEDFKITEYMDVMVAAAAAMVVHALVNAVGSVDKVTPSLVVHVAAQFGNNLSFQLRESDVRDLRNLGGKVN